jgi:hypothetical protein
MPDTCNERAMKRERALCEVMGCWIVRIRQAIAGGGADVIVDWTPSALASPEKGVPLVNISQPFKKSGLEITCRAETGIKKPTDLPTGSGISGGGERPLVFPLTVYYSRNRFLADKAMVIRAGAMLCGGLP